MSSSILHKIYVESQDRGLRLDKFLVNKILDLSRSRLQQLIEGGYVQEKGVPLTGASFKVKEGQLIEVTIPPMVEAAPLPQEIPLHILYEDNDIIVINKEAGMVVHPAPGNWDHTLVNALLNHCEDSLSGINGVKRPGIVHRLDKETSGLLVVAKNDQAHQNLSYQLSSHKMGRVYYALVWGMIHPRIGTVEGAIGRDPRYRQRMALVERGKFARTHYKVLQYFGKGASLVECRLETGRTHQIRVHLTSKGHPLIGDRLYGKPPRSILSPLKEFLAEKWSVGRQALHAKELVFFHPSTHEKQHYSTELPEDMLSLIDMLQSQY